MILTVTLNAALDITYHVPELKSHATNRPTEVAERAGGKGLNVARVLAALGHETAVTGFVGGGTGEQIRAGLARLGPLTDAFVPISAASRRTVTVVDAAASRAGGDATVFNEPGPSVSEAEWRAFTAAYRALLGDAQAVALCGSEPRGYAVGGYSELVRAARDKGVPVLLDTSDTALRGAIAAGPDIVKPNADELAAAQGRPAQAGTARTGTAQTGTAQAGTAQAGTRPDRVRRAAAVLRDRGARSVVASLGPDGLFAFTPQGAWHAAPPRSLAGNPTGAGDSAVAGLLSGLVEGLDWPQRLARAVALSAATVPAPVAGEFDRAVYEEFLPRVEVTPAAGSTGS